MRKVKISKQSVTKQHPNQTQDFSFQQYTKAPSMSKSMMISVKKSSDKRIRNICESGNQEQNFQLDNKQSMKILKLDLVIQMIESLKDGKIQELYDLLSQYSFFKKIKNHNEDFYRQVMKVIQIEKIQKGKIIHMIGEKAQKSYFIIKGKIGVFVKLNYILQKIKSYHEIYEQEPQTHIINPISKKRSLIIQEENSLLTFQERIKKQYQKIYSDGEQFKQWFPDLIRVAGIQAEQSIDQLALKKNLYRMATLVTQQNTLLISLKNQTFQQISNKYESINCIVNEKVEFLKKFKIFESWKKRLVNNAVYFERKLFKRGQFIYKKGEPAQYFYLIVEGEVQVTMEVKQEFYPNSKQEEIINENCRKISVNILGKQTYFGEQEIINKSLRKTTVQSISAYTEILLLTKKNLFIINYGTDLLFQLKQNLELKISNRQNFINNSNNIQVSLKKQKTPEKKSQVNYSFLLNKPEKKEHSFSKINNRRYSTDHNTNQTKVLYLHGNKIQFFGKVQKEAQIQHPTFTMLQSNKDMYQSTLKKFKKYQITPKITMKNGKNRDMKRVWKLLNLDQLLSEQNFISNDPEGIKYFNKHNRLKTQIKESKGIRPKTSSSSHQQKMKYITYLQQFNKAQKIRIRGNV